MENLLVFLLQIATPILLGVCASLYLKDVTAKLLVDLCGTQERSDFWVRITTLLTITGPTLLVLAFGNVGGTGIPMGEILRHTLSLSLLGIVISVAFLARTIWKNIPQPPQAAPQTLSPDTPQTQTTD